MLIPMSAMWYSRCPIPTCKRHPRDFYAGCGANPVKNKDWQGLMEAMQQDVDDAHPEVESFWDDHAELNNGYPSLMMRLMMRRRVATVR